jgi:protein-S-isoprenylcysteine O-methyltransferase Ste14
MLRGDPSHACPNVAKRLATVFRVTRSLNETKGNLVTVRLFATHWHIGTRTVMTLREHLEASGRVLFRRRSWLPSVILVGAPLAFINYRYPFHRHDVQEVWVLMCMAVAVIGQLIRFFTIGYVPPRTSGRNRKNQVADSLNTDGMYSLVRNPLYLGNCLSWLGLAAVPLSPWLWVSVALVFCIYHERVILAEEAFLEGKFGDTFRNWAAKTPAFLPNLRGWKRPELPFSFRLALGREYINWFSIFSGFAALDALADSAAEHYLHMDQPWAIAWGIAFVLFVVVRFLKKQTLFLSVPGRA